jgi:signal peptidase II
MEIPLEAEKISVRNRAIRYFMIAVGVILIDQCSKLLVHSLMYIHQEITIIGYGDGQYGFKLHYLLNPGMAFGIRWKSEFGKLFLTIFRMAAMVGISFYLVRCVRKGAHTGFLVSLSLILGGAVGNVIDSIFYGVLLNNELPGSVTPWFHGQVIDMLFFPLFEIQWPSWIPGIGGENFLFFSPVFNIADSAIFVGVTLILIFQGRFFSEAPEAQATDQFSSAIPTEEKDRSETGSPWQNPS